MNDTTPEGVRKWGVTRPVYYFEGEIIDGRKLSRAAAVAGVPLSVQIDFETVEEAMHHLAVVHPARALKRWPCATAGEASQKFGVPLKTIAKYFQPAEARRKFSARRQLTGQKTRTRTGGSHPVQFYVSSQLRKQIDLWAAEVGVSASEYMRAALLSVSPEQVRQKIVALSITRDRR